MLYYLLFNLNLFQITESFGVLHVFRYITFRAMCSLLFAFFLTIIALPKFIVWLRARGVQGQPIRDDGPKEHFTKQGTPTMGGVIVIGAMLISSLLFCKLSVLSVWLILLVMVGFCAIGFVDDWRKITKQNSLGLSERQKMLSQLGLSALVIGTLLVTGFSSSVSIPFTKAYEVSLSWWWFLPFAVVVVVGTSNAVNLTDGLDGLAIGPTITVAATYGLFAYLCGHEKLASYLDVYYHPSAGEISIVLAAAVGAGLGFLWFNCSPAQIFMGDTGALALGGTLGFAAVLTKNEIVLVLCGGIFVVEALSVILQRYYYKMTKKRIFRMAPIHHHFELLGWPEQKIVIRFWIISMVLAILTLTTLKIR